MSTSPKQPIHTVGVVLDEAFDSQLATLAGRIHVWLVASKVNRSAARRYWGSLDKAEGEKSETVAWTPDSGVTVFEKDRDEKPVETLLRILEEIEVHHDDPPVTRLEVHGLLLDNVLLAMLLNEGLRAVCTEQDVSVFELLCG